jgi:hypothetical protein
MNLNLYCFFIKIYHLKFKKMDYKKVLGQILIVAAGVAVYNLALKPLLDKAKIGG